MLDDPHLDLGVGGDALSSPPESAGRNPEFTGARLFSENPTTYTEIVRLTAEGMGALRIARLLHVSAHTVLAVREREAVAIGKERQGIATTARGAAGMCVEAIVDRLGTLDPKTSLRDLAITAGIMIDKSELLSGLPTSRVDMRVGVVHADLQEYMDELNRFEGEKNEGKGDEAGGQGADPGGETAAGQGQEGAGPAALGPATAVELVSPAMQETENAASERHSPLDPNEGAVSITPAISVKAQPA